MLDDIVRAFDLKDASRYPTATGNVESVSVEDWPGFTCLVPLVSSILLSILLTVVLNIVIRLLNR